MTILAVVPARGQSKRLPAKNIRPLAGKPLIVWTIETAAGISGIGDVLVSTDDPSIADVARQAGALVPWLRPDALATDTARAADVALHALDWYERERAPVDGVLLLQPTSPFRTRSTIRRGLELFERNGGQPVIGVSPAGVHPMWMFTIDHDTLVPFLESHGLEQRSQDLPGCYTVNGCLYLVSPADLRRSRSFFAIAATPLLVESPAEQLDIDTEWDWRVAECVAAAASSGRERPDQDQ